MLLCAIQLVEMNDVAVEIIEVLFNIHIHIVPYVLCIHMYVCTYVPIICDVHHCMVC